MRELSLFLTDDQGDPITKISRTIDGVIMDIRLIQEDGVFIFGCDDHNKGEVIITESLDFLCDLLKKGFFNQKSEFFIHRWDTFEDAYSEALSLKEENERCYNAI